jgi:signal peptidase I
MRGGKKRGSAGKTIVFTILMLLVVAVIAVFAASTLYRAKHPGDETFLGYKPLRIVSDSMEPTIQKGAMIIVKEVPFNSLEVGDIITFERPDGSLNTHRIIAFAEYGAITQGDNASFADASPVNAFTYKYKTIFVWNWVSTLFTRETLSKIILWALLGTCFIICLASALVLKEDDKRKEA